MLKRLNLRVVIYQKVKCKSFLHGFNKPMLPFRWGANPYRGCEHSCPYCFARYTHEYLGYNTGSDFDQRILVKTNAAQVLEQELSKKNWRNEAVSIGTVCDPYQPAEKEFRITRSVLDVFKRFNTPIYLTTKSNLIVRDADLLASMPNAQVNFTITTTDESIREKIEPNAAPTQKRLDAMEYLHKKGVPVGVLFMPVFPYLTDNTQNIQSVVSECRARGAKFIMPGALYLRKANRLKTLNLIRREWPQLFRSYLKLYSDKMARKRLSSEISGKVAAAKRKKQRDEQILGVFGN